MPEQGALSKDIGCLSIPLSAVSGTYKGRRADQKIALNSDSALVTSGLSSRGRRSLRCRTRRLAVKLLKAN